MSRDQHSKLQLAVSHSREWERRGLGGPLGSITGPGERPLANWWLQME